MPTSPAPPEPGAPWRGLPEVVGPVELIDAGQPLDELVELPEGSAMTVARIDSGGAVVAARYRGTGDTPFYPASTIKWVTAFMALRLLRAHGGSLDTVLELGGEPARSARDLVSAMMVVSDNPAFNTLQEAAGFAETDAALRAWGVRRSAIRRHFVRPYRNDSRAVRLWSPGGGLLAALGPRPAAQFPMDTSAAEGVDSRATAERSNQFTTDDLVRVVVGSLAGPEDRGRAGFETLCGYLSATNQCFVREGLGRLTARRADRPVFVVLNKPGWWPPDGANADAVYVHDVVRGGHFAVGLYVQGTMEAAREASAGAAEAVFGAILDGRLTLSAGAGARG